MQIFCSHFLLKKEFHKIKKFTKFLFIIITSNITVIKHIVLLEFGIKLLKNI